MHPKRQNSTAFSASSPPSDTSPRVARDLHPIYPTPSCYACGPCWAAAVETLPVSRCGRMKVAQRLVWSPRRPLILRGMRTTNECKHTQQLHPHTVSTCGALRRALSALWRMVCLHCCEDGALDISTLMCTRNVWCVRGSEKDIFLGGLAFEYVRDF